MSDIAIAFCAGVVTAWLSVGFGCHITQSLRSGKQIARVPWKAPVEEPKIERPVRSNLGNL